MKREQDSDPRTAAELRRRFHDHMGIEVTSENGTSRAVLAASETVTNALGTVHGGAIAALIDVAVTAAARSTAPDISYVVTISLSVSYLAPAKGTLTATAHPLSAGRRIVTTGVDVFDAEGTKVATGMASLRLIRG